MTRAAKLEPVMSVNPSIQPVNNQVDLDFALIPTKYASTTTCQARVGRKFMAAGEMSIWLIATQSSLDRASDPGFLAICPSLETGRLDRARFLAHPRDLTTLCLLRQMGEGSPREGEEEVGACQCSCSRGAGDQGRGRAVAVALVRGRGQDDARDLSGQETLTECDRRLPWFDKSEGLK